MMADAAAPTAVDAADLQATLAEYAVLKARIEQKRAREREYRRKQRAEDKDAVNAYKRMLYHQNKASQQQQ